MCNVLQLPKRTFYYEEIIRGYQDDALTNLIVNICSDSHSVYGKKCHYISIVVDLYNLDRLELFHTDRVKVFKIQLIDDALENLGIKRSLSEIGMPYDNTATEAMFRRSRQSFFPSQQALDLKFLDYLNSFNPIRIHGSLGYFNTC